MNKIFNQSCVAMDEVASGSVHCCVTSPPYWGLRDYGCEGQIGLEETPGEYVARLVAVFREVRRVLRDDGTLWLNLGDSYFGDSPVRKASSEAFSATWDPTQTRSRGGKRRSAASIDGLKAKDLVGIPWRVALALQSDGWWLRSEIIWHKPSVMPDAAKDRPTRAHEHVFLLTKRKSYFYDQDAIREPHSREWIGRESGPTKVYEDRNDGGATCVTGNPLGANARTVWEIAPSGYSGAHFAVMPQELVRRCILAGSPPSGIVLDPFMGSGTVADVALGCGRQYVGYELNPEYCKLIQDRLGLFGASA